MWHGERGAQTIQQTDIGAIHVSASARKVFLREDSSCALQVDKIFSEDRQCLSRLKTLNLGGSQLDDLPNSIAAALRHLQRLDLSNNKFELIPASLGRIGTLQILDMSRNEDLELTPYDLDTLAALSRLTSLCLCKNPYNPEPSEIYDGFSEACLIVLQDITVRFPKLHLPRRLHHIDFML